MSEPQALTQRVERRIIVLRGQNVMLDADLAELYGVTIPSLNQAVKRNATRFPDDFMSQLTGEEVAILRSQSVISRSWGGRRYRPYAFTEQGVAMLSSVLRSGRAAQENCGEYWGSLDTWNDLGCDSTRSYVCELAGV